MKQRTGFTLIELLVVIAIIGILSTLAIVALGGARQKARDSKRVADLNQVSKAMELYYSDNNDYPTIITPGQSLAYGSTTYMAVVPSNPTPRTDGSCENNNYSYTYTTGDYSFATCLGSGTGSLGNGAAWATSQGMGSSRDGLVGFWKLDEGGTSPTTADSSGNGNTGSLAASPVWTTSSGCKYSNCLAFTNANDYVSIPNSSSINVTGTKVSFGGWTDFTGINASSILMDKLNSYRIYAKDSGLSWCVIGTGSGWGVSTTATAPATGWHHIFCTYNGTVLKLFIDGSMVGSVASTTPLGSTVGALRFGMRSDATASEINTGIDNVRLYNAALTDAQVKALYLNDSDN